MPNIVPQLKAGGDVYPSRFVKMSAAADFTLLQADANAEVIGIAQEGSKQPPLSDLVSGTPKAAEDGDPLHIYTAGDVVLLECGDNVTRGELLKSDADGKGVPVAATGTVIQNYGAIALQNGADGEKILVQARFGKVRPALT